jgi:CheY-like chemotaxis protein
MPLTFQILLIDDDDDDQLLIKAAWEKVYPVCNLTWISHQRKLEPLVGESGYCPDLLFLSWDMANIRGKEQLRALKESPIYRKIPIILLTELPAKEAIWEGYDAGASTVIVKPTKMHEWEEMAKIVGAYWLNGAVKLTTRHNTTYP